MIEIECVKEGESEGDHLQLNSKKSNGNSNILIEYNFTSQMAIFSTEKRSYRYEMFILNSVYLQYQ